MPADDLPATVHFGLDLTYACNYSCPYCVLPPVVKHRTAQEWAAAFKRMKDRHGTCYIYMSGGEPSIAPGFFDIVEALCEMHVVDLCTNLSWDVTRLIPRLPPDRFKVSATFHPTQVGFEEFLEKAVWARDYLPQRFPPKRSIYFVAYPPQMDRMEEYRRRLDARGLVLVPLPLMEGDQQAPANSEDEKRLIAAASPNKGTADRKLEFQLQQLKPEGRLCRAGHKYAMIRGDGSVDRCTRHDDRQLGNFFDENFRLFDAPKVCHKEWCPFESQWVVA